MNQMNQRKLKTPSAFKTEIHDQCIDFVNEFIDKEIYDSVRKSIAEGLLVTSCAYPNSPLPSGISASGFLNALNKEIGHLGYSAVIGHLRYGDVNIGSDPRIHIRW